jgi:hypothetical protein
LDITGVTGITEAQKASLKNLGAFEKTEGTKQGFSEARTTQQQQGSRVKKLNKREDRYTARLNTTIEYLRKEEQYCLSDSENGKRVIEPDSPAWFTLFTRYTSFQFKGQQGHFTARCGHQRKGRTHWYAYHQASRELHKRYLGTSKQLTLAVLEGTALVLQNEL